MTTDLSALVLLFAREDHTYTVLPYLYAPRERARERSRRDRVPYEQWAEEGYLTLTEGSVVDYEFIRRELHRLRDLYCVKNILADRYNATHLLTQLQADGFPVTPYGQGYMDMNAPTKELLALLATRRIFHGGHPVLRWMASVFSVEQNAAGDLKPSKKKSTDRIDGIVALIMALGEAMKNPVQDISVESW